MKTRALLGAGLGLAVALSLAVAPAGADGGVGVGTSSEGFIQPRSTPLTGIESEEPSAEEALAAAESIFTPVAADSRARAVPRTAAPDATTALRDLWLKRDELRGADAERADALLARPLPGDGDQAPDGRPLVIDGDLAPRECDAAELRCVQYTLDPTVDRATTEYAEQVLALVENIQGRLSAAGFKAPLADNPELPGSYGNESTALDVYLMDLRPYGLYGYCAPAADSYVPGTRTVSTYCVLDNDYVGYRGITPLAALQVTAAHEYFHAVQGAYDWAESTWLMEGSAAWVEDELYDSVNDNRQYLSGSQLVYPWLPLDYFNDDRADGRFSRYGSWIFLRYLSERYARAGVAPLSFMRRVWDRADSTPGKPNDSALVAVQRVIQAAPKTFPGGFARTYNQFAAANRLPSKYYSEGAAYRKAPAVGAKFTKRTKALKTTAGIDELPHLTSYTARLVPHKSYGKKVRLKVSFNLPARSASPGATVRVFHKSGKITTAWVPLNKKGDAVKRYAFSRKKIKALEVTVSNGSANRDYLRHRLTLAVLR